jgi:hypothetical protein
MQSVPPRKITIGCTTNIQAADRISGSLILRRRKQQMKKISSGLKTLFLVHFVVGLVVGLGYTLLPQTALGMLGVKVTDGLPWQMVGVAILAFTASSWFCYKETEWDKVKIVVLAEVFWTSLVVLVGLFGLLFGGQPSGLWINVILMAAFAGAFAYFYSKH